MQYIKTLALLGMAIGLAMPMSGADAVQIQRLTGVKAGVCVVLGCNSTGGTLPAELGSGSMLVHAIALDDSSLARARQAVESRKAAGMVIIEKIPVNPLPYVPNMANVVVIEDWNALAALGVTMTNVLEITAPHGVICIKKAGSWTKIVKPRPPEMADWTHPMGGADGNRVSDDTLVRLPLGLRWQAGLPASINGRSDCRSWVVANGRCFVLGVNDLDNVPQFPIPGKRPTDEYLAAYDSFNGALLWKYKIGERKWYTEGLNANNVAPIAADNSRVYVGINETMLALDAVTGGVVMTYPVKHRTTRMVLLDGVLVSAGWNDHGQRTWWEPWIPKSATGTVEAFSINSPKPLWTYPQPASQLLADNGAVFLVVQTSCSQAQSVVSLDLKTGKKRWEVPFAKLSRKAELHICGLGAGIVAVDTVSSTQICVLAQSSGKLLWSIPAFKIPDEELKKQTEDQYLNRLFRAWSPVVGTNLWYERNKYDPMTGAVVGQLPDNFTGVGCTPFSVSPTLISKSRGRDYVDISDGKATKFQIFSQRGQCIEGATIANGMVYAGQTFCRCARGQVPGFVAFGCNGEVPGKKEFESERPVEKGPAFGNVGAAAVMATDWPMFLHDPTRSAATTTQLPDSLTSLWFSAQLAACPDNLLVESWGSRLADPLTAPVVAWNKVITANIDGNQVMALDATTGKGVWKTTVGGRIDTSPTLYNGMCIFGCRDGWVYALDAASGKLAWRTRVAPSERRMTSFGQTESVWPARGSVLVQGDVVYATAGRSIDADGGIAALALKPATGEKLWASQSFQRDQWLAVQNDVLTWRDNQLVMFHFGIDPKSGKWDNLTRVCGGGSLNGIADGTWTQIGTTFSGRIRFGRILGELLAWNDKNLFVYDLPRRSCFAMTKETANTLGGPGPEKPKEADVMIANKIEKTDCVWWLDVPDYQPEAMLVSGDKLVVAGRKLNRNTNKASGFLWLLNAKDSQKLAEYDLVALPVFQGLAVANGKLYVSLEDGRIACYGKVK